MEILKSTSKGLFIGMVMGLPLSVVAIYVILNINADNVTGLAALGDSGIQIVLGSIVIAGFIGGIIGFSSARAQKKHLGE